MPCAPAEWMRNARCAMAAPAVLLFAATCLAQIVSAMRGGEGAGDSMPTVRGAVPAVETDEVVAAVVVDGEEDISLERHHGHGHNHYGGGGSGGGSSQDKSFDSYVFSMSYQPEFCRENNEKFVGCHNFMESWEGQLTIHGLWPNREDGTWPSTCTTEQLDTSLLSDLSDNLSTRWPNVKSDVASPDHSSFWAHEWSKHGTCSGMTQHEYFSSALKLLVTTPPVVGERYGSTVSRTELESGYGEMKPLFVCKGGYLSEVRVCHAKGEGGAGVGERIACSEAGSREDTCGDEIKIASFGDATNKEGTMTTATE